MKSDRKCFKAKSGVANDKKEEIMNLAKQLPFVFPNKVAVCSFSAKCESCKEPLTTDRIDADIVRWGAHIIVIKGVGTCSACHHVSHVEMKIRDDKSVYTEGKWFTAKADSRGKGRRGVISILNSSFELLITLQSFALIWMMLIVSTQFMDLKTEGKTFRLITYQGQIYNVTGKVENRFYKAVPVGGDREVLIPIKNVRKAKVADTKMINDIVSA